MHFSFYTYNKGVLNRYPYYFFIHMHTDFYKQLAFAMERYHSTKKKLPWRKWFFEISLEHLVNWIIYTAFNLKKSLNSDDTLANHLELRMENNLIVQLFWEDVYQDAFISAIKYINDHSQSGTTLWSLEKVHDTL